MSAECHKCGTDIVYPEGTWPTGECPRCTRQEKLDDLRHYTRRMLQALDGYWEHCDGYVAKVGYKNKWPRGKYEAEDWWSRFERYRAKVEALTKAAS